MDETLRLPDLVIIGTMESATTSLYRWLDEQPEVASLVPPRSPPPLASAISSLLDDRPRARDLGTRGREIFLERFTLERSTERMVALCRWVAMGASLAADDGLEVA